MLNMYGIIISILMACCCIIIWHMALHWHCGDIVPIIIADKGEIPMVNACCIMQDCMHESMGIVPIIGESEPPMVNGCCIMQDCMHGLIMPIPIIGCCIMQDCMHGLIMLIPIIDGKDCGKIAALAAIAESARRATMANMLVLWIVPYQTNMCEGILMACCCIIIWHMALHWHCGDIVPIIIADKGEIPMVNACCIMQDCMHESMGIVPIIGESEPPMVNGCCIMQDCMHGLIMPIPIIGCCIMQDCMHGLIMLIPIIDGKDCGKIAALAAIAESARRATMANMLV
ncbi:hypothetical protein EJB05_45307, partial [Eragrostis curvula]